MQSWTTVFISCSVLVPILVLLKARKSTFGGKPPGPKGWLILGNISDIPKKNPWLTYTEWGKIYGDIVYLEPLGTPTVILNNLEDIHELLDKRSAITASRPRMRCMNMKVMASELMGWDWDFAHMPHDDYWRYLRRHRKIFHQYFQQRSVPIHYPVIRRATSVLLKQLLRSPEKFRAHFRQFAGTVILKLTYDHEVESEDDYYVALADRALKGLLQVVHVGASIVDIFPILKYIPTWFPGAGFKKEAQIYYKWTKDLRDVPFDRAKKEMSSGSLGSCFVSESLNKEGANDEIIGNAAAIAYLAGSDTTVSIIASFILAMVHYPEVQARARKDIDDVTGGIRLPDLDDRESLPYIDAIISELFRWATPTPLAIAHCSQQPDIYKGYYFPSGTIFIPNVHGIFHDESRFSEPFKFKPERFLAENADFDPFNMGGFGYGRRICPGRYVALNSSWLAIAQMLAVFYISPPKDKELPPPDFVSGLVVHPAPFESNFIPRSDKALELIQKGNAVF
ncbi:O-methylsterigmatocystin oxidoreductase [Leucoagaricus sp. SymC.cos]|nr:O-methylsterigmatocystin oxidoreductase [Leucoagaricus sp. SymC.cos]